MVKRLYEYALRLKNEQIRKGLVLEWNGNFGEIAPLPGFSSETFDEAKEEAFLWMHGEAQPTLPSVRFGIASLKKPLQSVHIPLCSLGPKEGFDTMKLKLGHLNVNEAIDLVKEHLGKARLRLDFNQKWNLSDALEFASHFSPHDFEYLEEPVEPSSLVEFSCRTLFPIALDESIHMNWEEIPSLKTIVVKPTIVGSIPKVPLHLDLVLSSSYESGLGLLHIAHLANNHLAIGLDTYCALEDDILKSPINCSSGYFSWNASNPLIDFSKLCAL